LTSGNKSGDPSTSGNKSGDPLTSGDPVTFGVRIALGLAAGLTVAVTAGLTVFVGEFVVLLSLFVHPASTDPNNTTTMIAINIFFIKYASFCIYFLQEDKTLLIKKVLYLSLF
jgi:hypothetical protein